MGVWWYSIVGQTRAIHLLADTINWLPAGTFRDLPMYHHTYTLITLGPPYTTSLSCGFSNRSTVECTIKNRFFLFNGTGYIDKKEHISFPMYKEIQMGAVAKEVLPNI